MQNVPGVLCEFWCSIEKGFLPVIIEVVNGQYGLSPLDEEWYKGEGHWDGFLRLYHGCGIRHWKDLTLLVVCFISGGYFWMEP